MNLVQVAHGLQFKKAPLKGMNRGYQKFEMGTLHNQGQNSALMFPIGKKKQKHMGFRKKQKQFLKAMYKKTNFL